MSKLMYWLAAIGAVLWGLWYWLIHGLACGWATPGTPCRMKMPWELGAEDFLYLVIYPGTPVVILLVAAIVIGRRRKGD